MKLALLLVVDLALLFLSHPATAEAAPREARSRVLLAEGTKWATTAHVLESTASGPTVMIVGGMHGNETAGWRAAEEIRHWPIVKGTLVIVPRANRLGVAAFKRHVPDAKPYDLNRCFPSAKDGKIAGPLASSIWDLARKHEPDWLVDLHESVDYCYKTSAKRKTLGNTLICYPGGDVEAKATLMAGAASRLTSKAKKWALLSWPIEGSLARAAGARLGARAIIAETTRKDYLAIRIRGHRLIVHRLLTSLGMLPDGFSSFTMLPEKKQRGVVRVAIYNSVGTGVSSARSVERCLKGDSRFDVHRITATGIRAGALSPFDVVVFPGGTGSGTASALGASGRRVVRSFVAKGGGCLGICAGAYLVTRNYSWSLHVLDARIRDTRHWARGKGTVSIRLTRAGRRFFGEKRDSVRVLYAQGPLLVRGTDPKIPDYELIAEYRSEVAKNGAPRGVMIGTAAIARGVYGKGRVTAMSPHPESTKGFCDYIRKAILWLGQ
jgi:glutamine amidotransferase-like uncharacterized protein